MYTNQKTIASLLIAGLLAVGMAGCQKKEGPAERAGKQIDQTMEKAGEKMSEAGRDIQKSADDAKR